MKKHPLLPPAAESKLEIENVRASLSPAAIATAFQDNLAYFQAKFPEVATTNDRYMALAYAIRAADRQRHRNPEATSC